MHGLLAFVRPSRRNNSYGVQILAQVDAERTAQAFGVEEKLTHFLKVTMLFLEDENAVDAERFFVKVQQLAPPMS
jgi:hypothetical protein